MHFTKTKGDSAVINVMAQMTDMGWNVGVLITEHAKYDFLAEKDGRTIRVQVKSVSLSKKHVKVRALEAPLKNSWADKNGNHIIRRKKGDYELLVMWYAEGRKAYFITDEQLGDLKSSVTLILDKDYSKSNTRSASDYEEINFCSVRSNG